MFYKKSNVIYLDRILLPTMHPLFSWSSRFCFVITMLILLICCDIESSPGPKRHDSCNSFLVCHWNLNNMTAHNFKKINLLQAFNTINSFDVICLSVPYLNSSIAFDYDKLNINILEPSLPPPFIKGRLSFQNF